MRKRLVPILAVATLAWSVALAGLGVASWSYIPSAAYVRPAGPWTIHVQCMDGVAMGAWWASTSKWDPPGLRAHWTARPPWISGNPYWSRLRETAVGFAAKTGTAEGKRTVVIKVPPWAPFLLGLLSPAAWVWAWMRRRMARAGGFPVEAAQDA